MVPCMTTGIMRWRRKTTGRQWRLPIWLPLEFTAVTCGAVCLVDGFPLGNDPDARLWPTLPVREDTEGKDSGTSREAGADQGR